MRQSVSVIITVLNEAASLAALLGSLLAQTRAPDEIVVVDGGSTDGTITMLHDYARSASVPIRVLVEPGCNISRGRNIAIAHAAGPIIASTDAGVRLEPDWLERLTAPFDDDSPPDVVSGFFLADPANTFELALGAVTLPRLSEIDPKRFHPSSRSVAFNRAAHQAVGGYPEWLDYCEDLLFDFALRDAGYRFLFVPEAVVHFRPRPTLRAFIKQYYRYARGDGKADFWRYRHLIRYGTYGALVLFALLTLFHQPVWLVPLIAGGGATALGPYFRLAPYLGRLSARERAVALFWAPIIRWVGDLAKMVGYPVGVLWRWHHAPETPWPKRRF